MWPSPAAANTICPSMCIAMGCSWPRLYHGAQPAHVSGQAQGTVTPVHAGSQAATCPSHGPQLPHAGCPGCELPRQRLAMMPRLSSASQPCSAQEGHGAGLQHSTCPMLSLHPPGSLIKRSAAACLPGPAKSNHVAEVQLEMLSGTKARRGNVPALGGQHCSGPSPTVVSKSAPAPGSCWKTQSRARVARLEAGRIHATAAPGRWLGCLGETQACRSSTDSSSRPGTPARGVPA